MDADQRHADIIIQKLNLTEANEGTSPCEKEKRWEDEEIDLEGKEGRKCLELAARVNYLAQDRCQIQLAAKEICRGMYSQAKGDVKRLALLGDK